MPDNNLQRLVRKNLLHTLENVVESNLFRHIYVRDKTTGREFDAMDDGNVACAFTVSGVLALHGLIDHPHATVVTTLKNMEELGWIKTDKPGPGDVIYWPANESPAHIGFWLTDTTCVSNSSFKHQPVIHDHTMQDGRMPTAYYTHPELHVK